MAEIEDEHPEEEPGFDILTQWRLVEDAEVVDAAGESIGALLAFIPEDPEDGRPDYLVVEKGVIHRHRFYIPVEQIADSGSNYYTIAYTATNSGPGNSLCELISRDQNRAFEPSSIAKIFDAPDIFAN